MISVIICTHNPRPDYFARCLDALKAQTLDRAAWELILVDNASAPQKAPAPDLSWHKRARLVTEPKLGLTPARLRGIREAAGELLVLVDDDNVLDADYLETAWRIAGAMPFLGSWSGRCRPGFESEPPGWTRRYWGNLSVREFEVDSWSNLPRLPQTMPCGAGLCVRREVARQYVQLHNSGQRSVQFDRTGTSLLSGGDNDLAACACDIGLGVGLMPALKLVDLIPPERLTQQYLARLAEGIYFSAVVLAYQRRSADELAGYRVRLRDWLRLVTRRGPHRAIQAAALRGRRRGLAFIAHHLRKD